MQGARRVRFVLPATQPTQQGQVLEMLFRAVAAFVLACVPLVLAVLCPPAKAKEALVVPVGAQPVALGRLVDVALDPTRQLGVQALIDQPQRFTRWPDDSLNLGITAQATWIRLTIRNPKDVPVDWYLDMGDGLIDEATLHEPMPDGSIRSRSTGLDYPWASRDVPLSQIVFALREPAGSERTIYLRVVAGYGKRLMLRAHAPEHLPRVSQVQSMAWGSFIGVFAGVGAYHFVLFLLLKDMAFFWHTALMASALMSRLLIQSFGLETIWPQGFVGYGALNLVFTALIFVCALMFALQVLPLRDISRWWGRLLSGLRWCWVGVLVWAVVAPGAYASMALTALGLPTQIVVLLAAVAAWRTGSAVARWFLPAWAVLIVGGLIWSARNAGWVPLNDWTLVAGSLGLALHTLLLSGGLALRMREEQQARLKTQLQLAEERRLANQQLERRVQERTAELQAAREKAESANQTKDLVVRMVSHDLRSPLASIVAASERLAESPTAAAGIRRTAWGLIRLIDRFLDLDYLRSGGLVPQRAWVAVQALVERQLGFLQGSVESKGLRVEVELPPEARLFADPALIAEVVANLLGNAVKACPPGGRIRVLWAEPSGLWVEDDGPGFGKLPSGGRGTGLGLDHCREILKVHGGQLEIASPPAGARVGFVLPAAGPRVLLVDDQPAQRRLLSEELQRIWPGCQLFTAGDGLAGWKATRQERPDLIILDRCMPALDGLGLLKRLRQDAKMQAVPVLMMSSVASTEEEAALARSCTAAGADAFLAKPVNSIRFETLVCSLLSADDDV